MFQTMSAGRELDAIVAEKVMGFIPVGPGEYWNSLVKWRTDRDYFEECQEFSTDIAAAWQVVERLQSLGCNHFSLDWEQPYDNRPRHEREADPQERPWLFAFNAPRHLSGSPSVGMPDPVVLHAPTAPLAICYGALIAVGVAYELGTDVHVVDPPSH